MSKQDPVIASGSLVCETIIKKPIIKNWQTLIISTKSCYFLNCVNKRYISTFMKLTTGLISKTIHHICISFSRPGWTERFQYPFWNKQLCRIKKKQQTNKQQPTNNKNKPHTLHINEEINIFNRIIVLNIKIACRYYIHS